MQIHQAFIKHHSLDYMLFNMSSFILQFIAFLIMIMSFASDASILRPTLVIRETPCTRLCATKNILTANGLFPGPTIFARRGDTMLIDIINQSKENITIHWHGVKQPKYPWSDGPEYITQCPIRPGGKFSQCVVLSDEVGTLWWHAHSDWSRATVHGLLVVYPPLGISPPFPVPPVEVPLVLGEWWKSDVRAVMTELVRGGNPPVSDAYLINGQPGDLYDCSKQGTFKMEVSPGNTYLLRMVNAVMNNIMFFAVANHQLTVIGTDGSPTKSLTSNYIAIAPGQTMDILLEANQEPDRYYIAAKPLSSSTLAEFDNTTTTAFLEYTGLEEYMESYTPTPNPPLPRLPGFRDVKAQASFTGSLRSLANSEYPINVPMEITTRLMYALSFNLIPCAGSSCRFPGNTQPAASVNNISFVHPKIDVLQAYYNRINGVFNDDFPDIPPLAYNYTAELVSLDLARPEQRAAVKVLEYGTTVEIVFQNTNILEGIEHPMHLHGYNFYVVGWGFGNFDKVKDPLKYNLVDPPHQNTIAVPKNGWIAIRFNASNPGVWLMHCHLERHVTWGMMMAFIVKDGQHPGEKMLPPPANMPPC